MFETDLVLNIASLGNLVHVQKKLKFNKKTFNFCLSVVSVSQIIMSRQFNLLKNLAEESGTYE